MKICRNVQRGLILKKDISCTSPHFSHNPEDTSKMTTTWCRNNDDGFPGPRVALGWWLPKADVFFVAASCDRGKTVRIPALDDCVLCNIHSLTHSRLFATMASLVQVLVSSLWSLINQVCKCVHVVLDVIVLAYLILTLNSSHSAFKSIPSIMSPFVLRHCLFCSLSATILLPSHYRLSVSRNVMSMCYQILLCGASMSCLRCRLFLASDSSILLVAVLVV